MAPSLGECVRLACVWEVTARKAGNVHLGRDFADVRAADFLASAAAIAPVFERAAEIPVGQTVLNALQATRACVATNTNLGIVLLIAPLARVPRGQTLEEGVPAVLDSLSVADSRNVFAAIRLANPGGMGKVPEQDLSAEPTLPLRPIMELAAGHDLVARQYVNGFQDVLGLGVPALLGGLQRFGNLEDAIILTQLIFLAQFADSLISRKRGRAEAEEARCRALAVLEAGWPETTAGREAFVQFDAWLTALGNARNPGTSADLVTACLFAALRQQRLAPATPFSSRHTV